MNHQGAMVSLEDALYNGFLFSKIFLVLPLNLKAGTFHFSTWRCFFAAANCILIVTSTYIHLYQNELYQFSVQLFMQIIYSLGVCFIVVSVYKLCFMYKSLNLIVNDIRRTDIAFLACGIQVKNNISLALMYLTILGCLLTYFIDIKVYNDGYLRTIYYYWCNNLLHVVNLQVTTLLDLLCFRFEALCARIKEHKGKCYGYYVNHELIMLAHAKDILCKTAQKINDQFSVQFLILVTAVFICLVSNMYFVNVFYLVDGDINFGALSVQAFWIYVTLSLVISTAKRTSFITKKVKEFNSTLYQLMINDYTNTLSNNKKLRLHVVMNREIVFTACGFFNLDYTLVHSMVAAATTYLVIVIQIGQAPSPDPVSPTAANCT